MFESQGYGVIASLAEAHQAAQQAAREGLLGFYPAACVVLARSNDQLRALWLEWETGAYDGPDLLRRVRLALHGPLGEATP